MAEQASRIDALSPEQIVEAAATVFADRFDIINVDEVADLIVRNVDGAIDRDELIEQARQASAAQPDKIAALLADAIDGLSARSDDEQKAAIDDALMSAGERQIVVGVEYFALGALLLCFYVVWHTRGVKDEETTVEYEELADGRKTMKVHRRKINVDPFGPIAKIFDALLGKQ